MTELEISIVTGTSRTDLARFRRERLAPGQYTKAKEGIVYKPDALVLLAEHLGLKKIEAPPAAGSAVTLTVRKACLNPRIVECSDGQRHDLRLQVRDSSAFRPGQLVDAVAVDALHGLYALTGPQPRPRHA
jgi:hypothetical protein